MTEFLSVVGVKLTIVITVMVITKHIQNQNCLKNSHTWYCGHHKTRPV